MGVGIPLAGVAGCSPGRPFLRRVERSRPGLALVRQGRQAPAKKDARVLLPVDPRNDAAGGPSAKVAKGGVGIHKRI